MQIRLPHALFWQARKSNGQHCEILSEQDGWKILTALNSAAAAAIRTAMSNAVVVGSIARVNYR
jgi:hypothetical protein